MTTGLDAFKARMADLAARAPEHIEICLGCGRPTAGRDCGCPAGTAMQSSPAPRLPHTMARRTDPITSHDAARLALGHLTALQEAVLAFLRSHGPAPDHEWMPAFSAAHPEWNAADSSLRTRRSELCMRGLVRMHPTLTAQTPSGRDAVVWEVK